MHSLTEINRLGATTTLKPGFSEIIAGSAMPPQPQATRERPDRRDSNGQFEWPGAIS